MTTSHLETAKSAEDAFAKDREAKGHQVVSRNEIVDLITKFKGVNHYYEVKSSGLGPDSNFFGSVTANQMKAGLKYKNRFHFVIAKKVGGKWKFELYTLSELLKFCVSCSLKFPFNIPKGGLSEKKKGMTISRLKQLLKFKSNNKV